MGRIRILFEVPSRPNRPNDVADENAAAGGAIGYHKYGLKVLQDGVLVWIWNFGKSLGPDLT